MLLRCPEMASLYPLLHLISHDSAVLGPAMPAYRPLIPKQSPFRSIASLTDTTLGSQGKQLHPPHLHRRRPRPTQLHRHCPRLAAAALPLQVAWQRAILHAVVHAVLLHGSGQTETNELVRALAFDAAREADELEDPSRDEQ